MDVIRDIRTDYKDFLARLFIDFLLLWMRFVDRIYRRKNGSGITVASKEERIHSKLQDKSRQRNEDDKGKANEWTKEVDERNARRRETTELKEEEDSHLERTEEVQWLRHGRHSSNYSESLEEVDSSILESTHDLQRQISALSDYYSDDEDLSNRWTTAKRDEAIAESLAIAENLKRGSFDFRRTRSTYESFCEGLEKLRDDFKEILEKWKKRNEESVRDLRGFVSVEDHRRRSDAWNRYAEETMDWRGSDSSVLNGSLERSTSRLNESLRERESSLEQHRQMLVTHEHLMQQRNTLTRRMSREYSETKELLILLEKKRVELAAKVNDQEWKSLSDSCDDLYAQQPHLRDHCKRLSRDTVARRRDVQDGVEILRAAVEGLSSCLSDESERLKFWSEKKVPKFNQIEQVAYRLKRQFDERRTVVTEVECNSYVTKLTDCLNLHASSSAQFLEEWNAVSHRAKEILKQKYLDLNEHEERCFEWKEFSEVDEFREEYERHLEAFQEYVPRICQIHERRSPGSTGIFGPKPETVEFNKFYQNYKRKMKAIGEDYSDLESWRMRCCQDIDKYRELYDVLLGMTEKQRQIDEMLREEELMIRMTQEKLKEYRDSVHLHLVSNQGKRLTDEKRQIVEFLKRIEKQLNESNQVFEMSANSLAATRNIIEEIEKVQVLLRHFERLESFAADWEKHKSYEKLFDLISQIENFRATEKPFRLEFEAHEERVNFLEKRLPKIVELHQGNYSTYLQTWLAYSLEYNESEQEPFSFDEMKKQYETWSSDCERISQVLENLKKEFTARHQQLHRIDEGLSLLSAQGYSLHDSESANSFAERFDAHFRRVEAACRNFKLALADFQPVYGQYFELKTGHHQVMETLAKEQYSSDKLTEKLENCKRLLRGHRDHLERRRIRIKIEELLASMKEVLFVKVKESEHQVKSLEEETDSLMNNFVDLSRQHFSDITQLQIPNLRELLISLDNFEQNLNDSEEKLGKCEETLIREEKTVHEYFSSVQRLTEFLKEAGEKTKVLEVKLEAGAKLLQIWQSFIESYTTQERSFDAHLIDSERTLATFKDAFNSAENEANDLDQLFSWYCSQFASDTSGDSFREKCFAELTNMSATMEDYRMRLHEAEDCIRTKENEARKRLEEGKRNKEGIRQKLTVLSKDISDQRELRKKSKWLLSVIVEKKVERESKAVAFKKRLQDENYKEHCKMYESNPMKNEEGFPCPLCSKITPPLEGIILRECLHRYCKKCLETHIRNSKTAEVACPGLKDQPLCFGVVLDKEIQTFGEDVNKLCADRSLSEYKDQNRSVLICGSCNKLIADDGQPRCLKPFFNCPYCEKKNCRQCKVVHEGNETCKDYQLTLPYRKIVESLKCTLCMEKQIQVAFIPCGHLVCCEDCVKKLRAMTEGPPLCPYCKTAFKEAMKIYLPSNDLKLDDRLKISKRK